MTDLATSTDPATSHQILFDGALHRVYATPAIGSDVIICFDPHVPHPSLDDEPFGFSFFASAGHSVIAVKSSRNDWYQNDEIGMAIAAINRATAGRRKVGYGSSMGGYAALNFSEALGLDRVVVIAPQVSVDPLRVPWEKRWPQEASSIAFNNDRVLEVRPVRGVIVYDPTYQFPNDRLHAKQILARHPLRELPLPLSGHIPLIQLTESGIIRDVILGLVSDPPRLKDAIAARRANRHKSGVYWAELTSWLLGKKRYAAALEAAQRAASTPSDLPSLAQHKLAQALYLNGRRDDAFAIWREGIKGQWQNDFVQYYLPATSYSLNHPGLLAEVQGTAFPSTGREAASPPRRHVEGIMAWDISPRRRRDLLLLMATAVTAAALAYWLLLVAEPYLGN